MFKKVREGVIQDTDNEQVPWESSSLIGSFAFNTVDESSLSQSNSTSNLIEESSFSQPQPELSPISSLAVTSGSTSEPSSTPSPAAVTSGTSSGLSETEIGRILRNVTVFTITINIPSAVFPPEETSLPIQIAKSRQSDYYISPDNAQQSIRRSNSYFNARRCNTSFPSDPSYSSFCSLEQLTQSFHDLLDITPISLEAIYYIDRDNRTQEEEIDIPLIPIRQQVKFARRISGTSDFDGVPLFAAKGGETGEYLTIEQNGKRVIPLYFEKEKLDEMIETFKEKNPRLADTVQIQVMSLEDLIVTLEGENSAELENIFLVPLPESLRFMYMLEDAAADNNILQNLDGTVIQNIDGTVTIQVH